MAESKKNKKNAKCATVIPAHWPKLTGPRSTGRYAEDRSAWFNYLRELNRVGPTPRVWRRISD